MEWNEENGDRRKEPRYEIWIEAEVITPDGSITAAAKNISGGGMEIQLPKALNPYTGLTITLQLHEPFVFQGIVVWTLGDYINKQWIYRTGIRTDSISFNNGKAVTAEEKRELVLSILPKIKAMGSGETLMESKAA
jgi:hypothetical protein